MDDAVKGLTIGLLTMLVLHGSLDRRARHAAERQMRESFGSGGEIHAVVHENAPFGLFANDIWALDMYGAHISAAGLPFTQITRAGWKGSIHHLRLHITDTAFADMPVSALDADIPNVKYDLGHALYKDRLLIRSAGVGPVSVWLDSANIAAIAQKKLGNKLTNVAATLLGDRILLSGEIRLISSPTPFSLNALVSPREGRYLDLTDAVVTLNGKLVNPTGAQEIVKGFNPILDVDKDLHLGGVLVLDHVYGHDNRLLIEGRIGIPKEGKYVR